MGAGAWVGGKIAKDLGDRHVCVGGVGSGLGLETIVNIGSMSIGLLW